MIKSAFKFGLIVFVGAALMGCSDGAAQDGNQVTTKEKPDFLKCLTSNNIVNVGFKDGSQISLPQGIILKADGFDKSIVNSKLQDVKAVDLSLPNNSNSQFGKCDFTEHVNIRLMSLRKPREGALDNPSPFTPVYTPNYAFALVPEAEMAEFFEGIPEGPDNLKDYNISVFKTDGYLPSNYRQRFDEVQIKRQQTIKVNPQYLPQVPYLGEICRQTKKDCAFFEIVKPGLEMPDYNEKLYAYLSITPNIVMETHVLFSMDDPENLKSLKVDAQDIKNIFEIKDYIISSSGNKR